MPGDWSVRAGRYHAALLPRRRRGIHEAHGAGVGAPQSRHQPSAVTRRRAIHRPQHGDLRLLTRADDTAVDDALVQVLSARRGGQGFVRGHRRENPGLELRDVRDDECPPGVRAYGGAQLARNLQRSSPGRCPPPGDHAAGDVHGTEPTVCGPLVEPPPAVRAHQPRQLLVDEQRRDRGMVVLRELPPARRVCADADTMKAAQQLGLRVEVGGRVLERGTDSRRGLTHAFGLLSRRRSRTERLLEDALMRATIPRQSGAVHLDGQEGAGGFRSHKQAQPCGVR